MTQNEQNSNTKKKCTHANHIDLHNFSYYSSVIKCRSLLAPTTFILQSNLTWLKFYSYPTITAKKAVKKKRSVYYSFSALSSQVTTDIGFLPVAFCWVLPCLFAISLAMTPTPLLFPVKMNYYSVQKLISSNSLRTYRSVGLWEILWNYITYKVTSVKQTLLLTEPLRVLKVKVTKSRTKHKANGSTKY